MMLMIRHCSFPEKRVLKYPNLGSMLDQLVARVETGEATAEEAAADAPLHQGTSVAVTIYLSNNVEGLVSFLENKGGSAAQRWRGLHRGLRAGNAAGTSLGTGRRSSGTGNHPSATRTGLVQPSAPRPFQRKSHRTDKVELTDFCDQD